MVQVLGFILYDPANVVDKRLVSYRDAGELRIAWEFLMEFLPRD